jgi:hypothetical protein
MGRVKPPMSLAAAWVLPRVGRNGEEGARKYPVELSADIQGEMAALLQRCLHSPMAQKNRHGGLHCF